MRFTEAVEKAGVSYRQADHWRSRGYLDVYTEGSGTVADISVTEALVMRRMGVLVHAGVQASAAARIARASVVQRTRAVDLPGGLRLIFDVVDDCKHDSLSGDEGPVKDLPGEWPVRWRCDGCGAIRYDDDALAALRRKLADATRVPA